MPTIKHALQSLAWYIEQDKENYAIIIATVAGAFAAFALLTISN